MSGLFGVTKLAQIAKNQTMAFAPKVWEGFVSTFYYMGTGSESESESESEISSSESSDWEEFDDSIYGCEKITQYTEDFVQDNVGDCVPLEKVFYTSGSALIRDTMETVTEESQCKALRLLGQLPSIEEEQVEEVINLELIKICSEVAYFCCCNTLSTVSLIIAGATNTLVAYPPP